MRKAIGLFIGLIFIICTPIKILAAEYTIENMQIDAFLQSNGDVLVTEEFTYQFNGSFNGMIRTLFAKEGTAITDVKATEDNTALNIERDDRDYLIHRKGKDEAVTVKFTYTIENGVDIYADVAEFYWSFFDSNNQSDYEQLDIMIHPPERTNDVIALGYEAAEGTEHVKEDGRVQFAFGTVKSGVGSNIRAAYDAELFPLATITKDTQMRSQILAEKRQIEEAALAFERQQSNVKKFAPFIISVFGVYFLALLLYAWREKHTTYTEVERRFPSPYFIPDETMSLPATILYTTGLLHGEALTASLLDLVRKGYVKQEDEDTFIVVRPEPDQLHESHLMSWLFYTIGTDGQFRLSDLKAYTDDKENIEAYQNDYDMWQQAIREEMNSYKLFKNKGKPRWLIGLTSALLLPCIVVFAIYELIMFMILGITLFVGLLLFAVLYRPRTIKGAKIKKEWTDFQQTYATIDIKEWEELKDDDQRRALIYGLGIQNKKVKDTNETLIHEAPNQVFPEVDSTMIILMATVVSSQFTQANNTASASGSGTSVGGGTGVGGSGGGSGAF